MNRLFTRVRISRWLAPLLVLLGALVGPGARAAELTPQQKQDMKQLYERATRAYDVGKYNEAIEEYQKAYEIGGDPPMLYNIAQAYRLNDQPGEALRFYRRYLQRAPNARNREDVERKIAELEKIVEDRRKAAAAVAPPPVVAPPPAPAPAPVTSPSAPVASPATPAPEGAGTAAGGVGAQTPPAEDEGPSRARKIVSWSLIGVGVATLGTGIVFGIMAKQKSNSVSDMSNLADKVRFDPNLEHDGKVYNNLFLGLGIAGAAVAVTGTILVLTGGSSAEAAPAATPSATTARATVTPWLGAGLAGAGASLRF